MDGAFNRVFFKHWNFNKQNTVMDRIRKPPPTFLPCSEAALKILRLRQPSKGFFFYFPLSFETTQAAPLSQNQKSADTDLRTNTGQQQTKRKKI